ncbi:MAG: protein BatD [Candidatus Omnitrophica bacterium]|nr:protein BatD [Candidatus Omnitrophota bacterium]
MMRLKFLSITLFLLPVYLLGQGIAAEEVKVSTIFDKKVLEVGDQLTLTLKIVGSRVNVQRPRIPVNESFDSFYSGRASRFVFMNGQQESITEFRYTLVPKRAGIFKVGPVEVDVNGEMYRTEAVEIEVLGTPDAGSTQGNISSNTFPASVFTQAGPATGATVPQSGATVPSSYATVPSAPFAGQSGYPAGVPSGYTARSTPFAQQSPVASPPISPGDDIIFLRTWVDKTNVYPGEQILLTYSIYTRADTTQYEGFEEEPEATGFWIEELPMGPHLDKTSVTLEGRHYLKADIRKMALFATAPGEFTILPGSVKASIEERPEQSGMFDDFFNDSFFGGGGLFARRINKILAVPPIQIHVKDLPERGKPKEFSGTIGRFTFTSSVDKQEVKQNEPVTLTLKIEGEGNIETLEHPPVPEIENFKIYEGESSSQLFKRGTTIVGSKIFEMIFIPEKAGTFTLPSILFNYFDPVLGVYKAERTPEYSLQVLPGEAPEEFKHLSAESAEELKKDLAKETRDVYTIKNTFNLFRHIELENRIRNILAILAAVLAVVFSLLFFARVRSRAYAHNRAHFRRKYASRLARKNHKRLSRIVAQSSAGAERAHFVEAAKILDRYFSDKFGLSPQGLTISEIENRIREFTIGDALVDEIRTFYEIADRARFTDQEPSREELLEMVVLIDRVITETEKKK